jgi:hypothetical protein
MTLDLVLAATAILLAVGAVTALAVLADRSARTAAWRQIALERRWNHEQRQQQR